MELQRSRFAQLHNYSMESKIGGQWRDVILLTSKFLVNKIHFSLLHKFLIDSSAFVRMEVD